MKTKSKLISYGMGLIAGGMHMTSVNAGEQSNRPNILFIPVDDLKPILGCYGDKEIHTK